MKMKKKKTKKKIERCVFIEIGDVIQKLGYMDSLP